MSTDGFVTIRELSVADEPGRVVTVSIKQPVPHGHDSKVEFQIVGLGDDRIRHAMGVDGAQALMLALQLIGTILYTSEEGKQGRLTWVGSRNLGFPVRSIVADLVPKE